MPDASVLRVEIPRVFEAHAPIHLVVSGTRHDVTVPSDGGARACATLETEPSAVGLAIRMVAPGRLATPTVRDWRPRVWPMVRRVMTETRDRSLPIIRNLRR